MLPKNKIMTLLEKLESIREQPESVRLRYVWLCVSVSMFFVFALWILSLQASFPKIVSPQDLIQPTTPPGTPASTPVDTGPSLEEMLQKSGPTRK